MENKYYFIRYMHGTAAIMGYEEKSNVINIHPFDWINNQPNDQCQHFKLLDYKEITEGEYKKWFNRGK